MEDNSTSKGENPITEAANNNQDNTPMATEQTIVEVVADEAAKRASPNRYVVTKAENLANMLVLVWSLFEETKKQHYLKTLKKLLEDVAPDLKHSPYPAGSKAMKAFYDFDNPMSDSDVMDLKNQFSVRYGSLRRGYCNTDSLL